MTPFIDFQFCVWESYAVAHAIVRHNETAYQTAFLTNLFFKKSLITWQVLNQNFLLITWGQYQKGFLYLRKKGKKMPGDDRRGRVKREITKLAPFALVTVPKSSFFLTCMLIHAQAKWPCHEGVFLIPHVSHYWKCWLHSDETFSWCDLFFGILQNKIWNFCLILATSGRETGKKSSFISALASVWRISMLHNSDACLLL